MKTAGVMFDFYDDPTGALLKSVFPEPDDLPESIKTAHILTPEEREVLRDDAYALVMQNEGRVFRKFACVDPGNTLLSAIYFAKVAHLLPEDVRDSVDATIVKRVKEFGLVEEKTAAKTPMRQRDPMKQPLVGDEADWAERTNLVSVQAGKDTGRVGTTLANLNTKTAGVEKTAAMKAVPGHWEGDGGVSEVVDGILSDVTGKGPKTKFVKKEAEVTALGHRFPLDSYADIRAAVNYFDDHWTKFQPPERHEFAVKVAARADAIGLEVSEVLARYGSTAYAPDVEAHIANRKANCEGRFHEMYDAMVEKRASIEPEHFAVLLAKADLTSGLNWHWGGAVTDPWLATFGGRAEAEKTAFGWEGGGYEVDAAKLQEAAANGVLKGNFNDDLVKAFEKDPVTIFSSLPDDSKVIIARLASE